jgi:hypothetical protein
MLVIATYTTSFMMWNFAGRRNGGVLRLRENRLIGWPLLFSEEFPPSPIYTGFVSVRIYKKVYDTIIHSRAGNSSSSDLIRYIAGDVGALVKQNSLIYLDELTLADTRVAIYQAILTQRQIDDGHNADLTPGARDIMW